DQSTFKCYMADTGLLISHAFDEKTIQGEELYQKIMLDKLEINSGMIIENVNGLIRQYIPKNTCFSNISLQHITKIMKKINTRPREKLNFSTPNECFYKKML
ncbi:MAG: hypothetical protein SPF70_03425, partial [Lachnospiraceae bacterium]|nr:hypothetical protein [Lachnospiraceae bacterium]